MFTLIIYPFFLTECDYVSFFLASSHYTREQFAVELGCHLLRNYNRMTYLPMENTDTTEEIVSVNELIHPLSNTDYTFYVKNHQFILII